MYLLMAEMDTWVLLASVSHVPALGGDGHLGLSLSHVPAHGGDGHLGLTCL